MILVRIVPASSEEPIPKVHLVKTGTPQEPEVDLHLCPLRFLIATRRPSSAVRLQRSVPGTQSSLNVHC